MAEDPPPGVGPSAPTGADPPGSSPQPGEWQVLRGRERPAKRPWWKPSRGAGCGCLVLAVLLVIGGFTVLVQVPLLLVFGWIPFLVQVVPAVRLEPAALATGLIALGATVAGVHLAGRWFARHAGGDHRWGWRWTARLTAVLLLLFLAGIAVVGTVHQALWLATDPEPLLDDDWGSADVRALYLLREEVGAGGWELAPALERQRQLATRLERWRVDAWIGPDANGRVGLIATSDRGSDTVRLLRVTWTEGDGPEVVEDITVRAGLAQELAAVAAGVSDQAGDSTR